MVCLIPDGWFLTVKNLSRSAPIIQLDFGHIKIIPMAKTKETAENTANYILAFFAFNILTYGEFWQLDASIDASVFFFFKEKASNRALSATLSTSNCSSTCPSGTSSNKFIDFPGQAANKLPSFFAASILQPRSVCLQTFLVACVAGISVEAFQYWTGQSGTLIPATFSAVNHLAFCCCGASLQ